VATAVAPVVPLPLPPQPVSNSAIATTLATDLIIIRPPIVCIPTQADRHFPRL